MVTKNDLVQFLLTFRTSAPNSVLMFTQLLHRADESVESTKRSRAALRKIGGTIRNEWNARNESTQTPDLRGALAVMANSWGALHGRLFSLTRLPEGTCEEQVRAAAVLAKVFPSNLGMFRGEPGAQWLHSDRLLKQVSEPPMRAEIDALAGAFVIPAIRKAHGALSTALGLEGEDVVERQPLDMRELLAQFVAAANDYAVQVVAVASDRGTQEALDAAYHQLEPIALYRSQNTAGADDEDAPVDGSERNDTPATPVNGGVVQPVAPANDASSPASRRVA